MRSPGGSLLTLALDHRLFIFTNRIFYLNNIFNNIQHVKLVKAAVLVKVWGGGGRLGAVLLRAAHRNLH